MTGLGPRKRTRYSPAPGTERCLLCREVMGPDHVRHPWGQIAAWLWRSHPAWRVTFVVTGTLATLLLGMLIAVVRVAVTGS